MSKQVLVLTNMGPTPKNPYQGLFVFRQVEALRDKLNVNDHVRVFSMPSWLGDKPSWFKYPLWFFLFLLTQSWRRYSHIHVHFFMPTAALAVAYKKLHSRARLFATFHGTDIYAYMPPTPRYRSMLGYFERLIFVSEKLKSRLFEHVKTDRASVLSAGIPDLFMPPSATEERTIDYLFVGNLNYNKGGDRLIDFARQLPHGQSLVIVGEGEYRAKLERVADNNPKVSVVGAQTASQICSWYQSSRWLLSLSRNESFGLVMTEAMACGTPVLATLTDGAKEQVASGVNGFVIEPSPVRVFEQVESIDADIWEVMSKNSIESAKKHKLGIIVERLHRLYSDSSN